MKKSKPIIGYTAGVYDLFHIGHLNLLKNAKGMCDKLIVGVTVDELVTYKGKHAMIPFEDRI
ncbi:adenylyltransferase/cytidyltransferase family protein, partial [Salmonella enterica]|uniref:adenylyltransferase/cytidyltransferase family protein n=1 Tax=Salmonella enterica TaxID=28901 RepID=UPI003075E6D2